MRKSFFKNALSVYSVFTTVVITVLLFRLPDRRADEVAVNELEIRTSLSSAGSVAASDATIASGVTDTLETSIQPGSITGELMEYYQQGEPLATSLIVLRLNRMAAGEASDAYEFLREISNSGSSSGSMWQSFWMRWGNVDLQSALERAGDDVPEYFGPGSATKHIFEGFAFKDPEAAGKYLLANPDLHDHRRGIEGLSVRWAEQDGTAVTDWALAKLEGDELGQAMFAIPWGIAKTRGFPAVEDWWDTLPADDTRKPAFDALAARYGRRGDATADELVGVVELGFQVGASNTHLLRRAASMLGRSDPERGINLLTRAAEITGDPSAEGAGALLEGWVETDPVAAIEWVQTQSDKPWADEAIAGIERLLKKSP